MSNKRKNVSKRKYCPHCDENVSERQYYYHKKEFFRNNEWRAETDLLHVGADHKDTVYSDSSSDSDTENTQEQQPTPMVSN